MTPKLVIIVLCLTLMACSLTQPGMLSRSQVSSFDIEKSSQGNRVFAIWGEVETVRRGLAILLTTCSFQDCGLPEGKLVELSRMYQVADYYMSKAWVSMYEGDNVTSDRAATAAESELKAIENALKAISGGLSL